MGCDIHAKIQHRAWVGEGGKETWYCDQDLSLGRDYELFHILAGVRTDERDHVAPVSYPKGLPDDRGEHSWLDGLADWRDGFDYHSHSWLSLKECQEAQRRYVENGRLRGRPNPTPSLPLNIVISILIVYKEAKVPARFVFCFDN